MARTTHYKLYYLDPTDYPTFDANLESWTWIAVDNQLWGLARLAGNGRISGWDLTSSGNTLQVGPGEGFVHWTYVQTTTTETIQLDSDGTWYIYWQWSESTPVTGRASLVAYGTEVESDDLLLLARVVVSDGNITEIEDLCPALGLTGELYQMIREHHHDGSSAPLIDLSSEVYGTLGLDHLPNIPASKISGQLDPSQLPQIPHEALLHSGNLSHEQLEDLTEGVTRLFRLGDVQMEVLSQLLLSLAHLHYSVESATGMFQQIPNVLLLIPGVSVSTVASDTYRYPSVVDWASSYGIGMDEENHYFYVLPASRLYSPIEGSVEVDYRNYSYAYNVDVGSNGITLKAQTSSNLYAKSGYVIYEFDPGRACRYYDISWNISAPSGTSYKVKVQLDSQSDWVDITESSEEFIGRVLRIKVEMSTTDVTVSPSLTGLSFSYMSLFSGCGRKFWTTTQDFEQNSFASGIRILDDHVELVLGVSSDTTYSSSGWGRSNVVLLEQEYIPLYAIINAFVPTGSSLEFFVAVAPYSVLQGYGLLGDTEPEPPSPAQWMSLGTGRNLISGTNFKAFYQLGSNQYLIVVVRFSDSSGMLFVNDISIGLQRNVS